MLRIFLLLILPYMTDAQAGLTSILETFDLTTGQRTEILREAAHFEAPNWAPDGSFLVNQGGRLYTVTPAGEKQLLPTDFADRCNNDHGISPSGKHIALSHNLAGGPDGWLSSCIYRVGAGGGTPERITDHIPSFWHGWSPDGKTLLYTARRNGQFDIYAIAATGGPERQLTDTPFLDDGPEYGPDGRYIYFNSVRSGRMELWRMDPDGRRPEPLTDDEYSNWFPHPSPDGKHLVFLSYLEDQGSDHPAMKAVALRLYDLRDGSLRTLCTFTGGQGTLNVPSWNADGTRFAFVRYENR